MCIRDRPEAVPDIPTDAKFPHYYDDFVAQADRVQQHLADVGEPEVAGSDARQPVERAVEVSAAFASAASRHREEAAAHPGSAGVGTLLGGTPRLSRGGDAA